jgi:hypothetical protein
MICFLLRRRHRPQQLLLLAATADNAPLAVPTRRPGAAQVQAARAGALDVRARGNEDKDAQNDDGGK